MEAGREAEGGKDAKKERKKHKKEREENVLFWPEEKFFKSSGLVPCPPCSTHLIFKLLIFLLLFFSPPFPSSPSPSLPSLPFPLLSYWMTYFLAKAIAESASFVEKSIFTTGMPGLSNHESQSIFLSKSGTSVNWLRKNSFIWSAVMLWYWNWREEKENLLDFEWVGVEGEG